jgi:hypothetical protein
MRIRFTTFSLLDPDGLSKTESGPAARITPEAASRVPGSAWVDSTSGGYVRAVQFILVSASMLHLVPEKD